MDWRIVIKVAITAILIVAISEVGKRSSFLGAVLASIPLTSLLALTWLYLDTNEVEKPAQMSMDIFWAVIPSLVFFPAFSWLLKSGNSFSLALFLAIAITAVAYVTFFYFLKH
jgi:hypothetical protein